MIESDLLSPMFNPDNYKLGSIIGCSFLNTLHLHIVTSIRTSCSITETENTLNNMSNKYKKTSLASNVTISSIHH